MKGTNKIVFMSQPSMIQQGQNGNNIPSLIGQPLIPIDISEGFTSYTQMNREIIDEVMNNKKRKEGVFSFEEINELYKTYKNKCNLHMKKLSEKCRKCKVIINNLKNRKEDSNSQPNIEKKEDTPHSVTIKENIEYNNLQEVSVSGNLNSLLLNNILSCQYFKEVVILKNYQDLIAEIKNNVTNIEAWAVGISGVPSTFFCCFYRLILLNLSSNQIKGLLNSSNIYIKISGLLYLRFLAKPNYLWIYLSPFLEDETLFYPSIDRKYKISIGEYIVSILKEYNHFGTRLPRIPTQIERDIRMKLICYEEKNKRKKENIKNIEKITNGRKVKIYSYDDKNNSKCEIGKVFNFNSNNTTSNKNNLKVNIEVNGKISQLSLGEFDLMSSESEIEEGEDKEDREKKKKEKKSHHHYRHHSHSKHRERSRSKEDIRKKVLEDERRTALAHGKDYAIKPTSFKKSISVKVPGVYKKKPSRSPTPKNIKIELVNNNTTKSISVQKKKEEQYSKDYLIRQQKLNEQYNNTINDKKNMNSNKDYIGPEIMKLG